MRVTTRSAPGLLACAAALLLASPGVRVSHAEEFVSHDPALVAASDPAGFTSQESFSPTSVNAPAVQPPASPAEPSGATCQARSKAPALPLGGVRLLMAERAAPGDESWNLNSLNARGYNIGKPEVGAELRILEQEVRRRHGH